MKKTRQQLRVERVWSRLTQAYGTRLVDTFGSEAPESWAEAINELEDDQIAHGLKRVIRDSPAHPPTEGQFLLACESLSRPASASGPTTQELLCAFATLKLFGRITSRDLNGPWSYLYREWIDTDKPKHLQRCAECTGLLIECQNGDRIRINVIDMEADPELKARAVRSFKPFAFPKDLAATRRLAELRARAHSMLPKVPT